MHDELRERLRLSAIEAIERIEQTRADLGIGIGAPIAPHALEVKNGALALKKTIDPQE